jgi:hypothetical protein
MSNPYCNLVGTSKIKDTFGDINTGFDGVDTDLTAHLADGAAHGLGHYFIQRTSSTLGGYLGETITCGFTPRKITCQAFVDTGTDKRQSIGFILYAGGVTASQCVGSDTNGYAIAAYNGDIGTLKSDASNYLQINVTAFSSTGFTTGVTRVGYAGDGSAILLMFMVE